MGISSLFGTFFETLWKKCARLEGCSSKDDQDMVLKKFIFIIGQWPVDALPRPINRRCANTLCAYERAGVGR
jgi:hypothetical protein